MTAVVQAIGVVVAWFSALVTLRHDVVGDAFAQTVIKHKILSDEFAFSAFFFNLLGIIDDAAFELKYVFEA